MITDVFDATDATQKFKEQLTSVILSVNHCLSTKEYLYFLVSIVQSV